MYNEESHCVRVVEDMCQIQWPREKLIIQVGKVYFLGLAEILTGQFAGSGSVGFISHNIWCVCVCVPKPRILNKLLA